MLQAAHEVLAGMEGVGPELQAAGVLGEVQGVGAEVLALLAWAHLEGGEEGGAEGALQCVHALRALGPAAAAQVAVPYLMHQALLRLGRSAEAEAALLNVVTHQDATPALSARAIRMALVTPGGTASARAALGAAMDAAAGIYIHQPLRLGRLNLLAPTILRRRCLSPPWLSLAPCAVTLGASAV